MTRGSKRWNVPVFVHTSSLEIDDPILTPEEQEQPWCNSRRARWNEAQSPEHFVERVLDLLYQDSSQGSNLANSVRLFAIVGNKHPSVKFRFGEARFCPRSDSEEQEDAEVVVVEEAEISGASSTTVCIVSLFSFPDGQEEEEQENEIRLSLSAARRLHAGLGLWLERKEVH